MTRLDEIDLRRTSAPLDALAPADLAQRVDDLGKRVDHLWRDALDAGDFVEVERLTNASQALHRAAFALRADGRIGT